jgi:hypothetical protein
MRVVKLFMPCAGGTAIVTPPLLQGLTPFEPTAPPPIPSLRLLNEEYAWPLSWWKWCRKTMTVPGKLTIGCTSFPLRWGRATAWRLSSATILRARLNACPQHVRFAFA